MYNQTHSMALLLPRHSLRKILLSRLHSYFRSPCASLLEQLVNVGINDIENDFLADPFGTALCALGFESSIADLARDLASIVQGQACSKLRPEVVQRRRDIQEGEREIRLRELSLGQQGSENVDGIIAAGEALRKLKMRITRGLGEADSLVNRFLISARRL